MRLRDYQEIAVSRTIDSLVSHRSALVVMPTGTGKTVCFAHLCDRWPREQKILIVAHRLELVQQAAEKIEAITGERVDVDMGELRPVDGLVSRARICVASVQTLSRPNRRAAHDPDSVGLVIIDEAHHAVAQSYRSLIEHFSSAKIAGFTATPNRADEAALGKIFESVAYEYGVRDAIDAGWLVPIEQQMVQVENLNLSSVRKTAGDFNLGELEQVLLDEKSIYEVAHACADIAASGRTTIAFCATVAHAKHLSSALQDSYGVEAASIDGESPADERAHVMQSLRAKKIKVLCNCMIATEGFDAPAVDCVAMARPTLSTPLYMQMLGRALRPLPGVVDQAEDAKARRDAIKWSAKPDALVLDFVGNSGRHKLITSFDALGGDYSDEVIERAKKEAQRKGKPGNVDEALDAADALIREEKRRARAAMVVSGTVSRVKISPFDVLDVTPARTPAWHNGREMTPRQREALLRAGFSRHDLANVGFNGAHQLLDKLSERRRENKCTIKQARVLAKYGESTDVDFWTASRLIDEIAKSGWKPISEDARRRAIGSPATRSLVAT